jgi:hypothetical protein
MTHAASGGVTHFALCPDDDSSVMTIAWYVCTYYLAWKATLNCGACYGRGQNAANGTYILKCPRFPAYRLASGELGLGDNEAKSATKPLRVNPLIGVDVLRCDCSLSCIPVLN